MPVSPPVLDTDHDTSEAPPNRRRWPWIVLLVSLALLILAAWLFAHYWPFTREKVLSKLQQRFKGTVEIRRFDPTYFPSPGWIIEGLSIRGEGGEGSPASVQVRRVQVTGHYHDFWKSVKGLQITADGLKVDLPDGLKKGSLLRPQDEGSKSPYLPETLLVQDSELILGRSSDSEPLRFAIHRLQTRMPALDRPLNFDLTLRNPIPPGEVRASGSIGPFPGKELAQLPVDGKYNFTQADLGHFSAIAGTLSSTGTFKGILEKIEVEGQSATPDFALKRNEHRMSVNTRFHAVVNGMKGDVTLQDTTAQFLHTTLLASGDIAGKGAPHGKVVDLDLQVRQGRIEDLIWLVTKSEQPAMTGRVVFRGKAVVPPTKEKFIRKVDFTADFDIDSAHFTNPKAQQNINKLSERARGDKDEDPERVVSDLRGHVVLRGGVARFSNVSFKVPGAVVLLHGTYNLNTKVLDFNGRLRMLATVSEATTGVKSFFLKLVDPFFKNKKKRAGADLPIKITGTYGQPKFGLALLDRRSK